MISIRCEISISNLASVNWQSPSAMPCSIQTNEDVIGHAPAQNAEWLPQITVEIKIEQ